MSTKVPPKEGSSLQSVVREGVVVAVLVAEIAECVLLAHSYGGRRIRSGGRPVGGTLHSLPAKEDVDLPCC